MGWYVGVVCVGGTVLAGAMLCVCVYVGVGVWVCGWVGVHVCMCVSVV